MIGSVRSAQSCSKSRKLGASLGLCQFFDRTVRHARPPKPADTRLGGGRLKVILTGGSYLDLMRRWKQPVFFDQQGSLAEKLGIRHVPALVSQEDRRLRIDELL